MWLLFVCVSGKTASDSDDCRDTKTNISKSKEVGGGILEQTMKISSSPHIRDKETTSNLMGQVIVALMPATIFGISNFGVNALITILVTIISCVTFEALYQKFMQKKCTVKDLSAVLTGLLLAINLPPDIPFWIPVIGSFFAIIVVILSVYTKSFDLQQLYHSYYCSSKRIYKYQH